MSQATRLSKCTVQRRNGNFCDAESMEQSPFPICQRHALKLYMFMEDEVLRRIGSRGVKAIAELAESRPYEVAASTPPRIGEVVYYIRIGDLIKIGHTANLRTRLQHYPPNRKLLAVEPGNFATEQGRLAQFRHLLAEGNEWFRPAGDLLDHVNRIRQASGGDRIVA
jgi:hypothetical protein